MGFYSDLLEGIVALENQVKADLAGQSPSLPIRVYPIRPNANIELPALYNWFPDGTSDLSSTHHMDDILVVTARIGIRHTDSGEEVYRLLSYAEAFADRVDQELLEFDTVNLGAAAQEAARQRFRTVTDKFADVPVLCAEFQIRARLRRLVRITP